jgi:hypothetical protein
MKPIDPTPKPRTLVSSQIDPTRGLGTTSRCFDWKGYSIVQVHAKLPAQHHVFVVNRHAETANEKSARQVAKATKRYPSLKNLL